jgi:hypothetical protein
MTLATGDALVFSPAAVVAADERGGVVLLGRAHLKLRVRPRLTLDGGASLLAVGRSLPALTGSVASPLSLSTPPIFEAYLPTWPVTRLNYSSSAANEILVPAMAFMPPSAVPTTSVTTIAKSTASGPRAIPARLKHLIDWLVRKGATDTAVKLNDASSVLYWVGKKEAMYAGMKGRKWWTYMLDEAVKNKLIELTKKKKNQKIRLLRRGPFVYE